MERSLSWKKALVPTADIYFFAVLSTITFFCSSVSIKYFWKVHAVLLRGKVKWQVGWCLLGSCLKQICTNREVGLSEGAQNSWHLASIPCKESIKRLFLVMSGWSYRKVLVSWEILCPSHSGNVLFYLFVPMFCTGACGLREDFPDFLHLVVSRKCEIWRDIKLSGIQKPGLELK